MAIDKYDWKKLDPSKSAQIRAKDIAEERIKDQRLKQEFDKQGLKGKIFQGLTKGAKNAGPVRVEKPAVPQDKSKPQDVKGEQAQRPEDKATERAESRYQEARVKYNDLNKVFKTQKPEVAEEMKQKAPEGALKQQAAKAETQGRKGPAQEAKQAAQAATSQAKPYAAKEAKQKGKKAGNKGRVKGQGPKVKGKVGKKGSKDAEAGVRAGDKPKGEAKAQAETQAAVAGGLHAKAEVKKDDRDQTVSRKEGAGRKGGKSGKTSGSKPAYAVSEGAEEATGRLGSLLDGRAEESPFDLERSEARAPATQCEPIEWKTGIETYTNIQGQEAVEEVRQAAIEHRQRTEKLRPEKVDYSKWDMSKKSIRERFVFETSQVIAYAQDIIEHLRLPVDPRGLGTNC